MATMTINIKQDPNVQAAVAMVIAASMREQPIHLNRLAACCDERVPEQLEYVLSQAAWYGVDVLQKKSPFYK